MDFLYLVPIALALGVAGLGAFMWALGSGQYEDVAGAAERILFDETDQPVRENRNSAASRSPVPLADEQQRIGKAKIENA